MEEKETFIEPVVEVVLLEEDVVCTSSCGCQIDDEMKELNV